MLKLIYFSNLFGVTLNLKLSLPNSSITRCESWFFRLWNTIENLWFNLTLILQSLCAKPLYFLMVWQENLTVTSSSI